MRALILSLSKIPNGDASAVRLQTFAKILSEQNYEVTLVGAGNMGKTVSDDNGLIYVTFDGRQREYLKKLHQFFFSLDKLPDLILLSSIPIHAFIYAKLFAIKNNIPLFCDCCEWFSPEEFKYGSLHPRYIEKNIINKYILDNNFNIISISTFLYNYFSKKGITSVRIPVILDTKKIDFQKNYESKKLRIMYAGSPSKKDYIWEIIKGISLLSDTQRALLDFKLFGIDSQTIYSLYGITPEFLEKLGCIRALGRVPMEKVLSEFENCDFTVLLRPQELRYTKAGFPTKVVESLSSGTPVILNFTSDLHMYLEDGKDCIKVDSCDAKSFYASLSKALTLSEDEKRQMSINSRKTAEKYFDYRLYSKDLGLFFNRCL